MNIHRINIIFVFILCSILSFGQKTSGDKHLEKLEYESAIPFYKKDFEKNGSRESLASLALCYHKTKKYSQALDAYINLEKLGPLNALQTYYLGQLYYENDIPEKGREYFLKYAGASGSKWWADIIEDNSFVNKEENNYYIESAKYINTNYSEFSPTLIENKLLFTSDRPSSLINNQKYGGTGRPFLNIFSGEAALISDSSFHQYYSYSDLSSHLGPAVYDSINSTMYFTFVNDTEKNKINYASILSVTKDGKKWTKPTTLSFCEPNSSYGHPAYYNNILVFSSSREGGKGGKDLYYSINTNGNWSQPKLVPGVNTPGDEVFPTFRKKEDGTIQLYFSSDGFPGLGGLDLFSIPHFSATEIDSTLTWHVGLSSNHDDFGITFITDSKGYLSSDRIGGKGADDIYYFIENPNSLLLCLTSNNDEPIGNRQVAAKKDNEILGTYYTDENGCLFLHKLPEGTNNLQILDNDANDLKIKKFESGVENKGKLVILDRSGTTMLEIENVDGSLLFHEARTLLLKDQSSGLPAKGITVIIQTINGDQVETIISDENGKIVLRKIPPGEKFIINIDADDLSLDPSLRNNNKTGIYLTDMLGNVRDSVDGITNEIIVSVVKIKTVDLCLYNQITGEPLAHYKLTVRANDGTPIDTVITDANGCYKFKKLPEGQFLITVENFDGGALQARVKGMDDQENKSFQILNSEGKVIDVIDSNGQSKSRTFCVYNKKTMKPVSYTAVYLANEQMVIIDSVETGTDGCFTYHKLDDGSKNLNLIFAADEAEFFAKSNQNNDDVNNKYASFNMSGELLDSLSSKSLDLSIGIIQKMIISGCLTFQDGKPLAFTKVYLKNDIGEIVDSTKTDANGCFEYKKLGGDISLIQIENSDDLPFVFKLNQEKSSIPNKLKISDKNNRIVDNIDPNFKFNNQTSNGKTKVCFYNTNAEPISGLTALVEDKANNKSFYLTTTSNGCISYSFESSKSYLITLDQESGSFEKSTSNSNQSELKIQFEKGSITKKFNPGDEIIVEVNHVKYNEAVFKSTNGIPVQNLMVEWYDESSKSWISSETDENGKTSHVKNKNQNNKIRVNSENGSYEFKSDQTSGSNKTEILDENGQLLATAFTNGNNTYYFTADKLSGELGDNDISGLISSSGAPISNATVYVRTPEGVLIQRSSSDKDGKYYFKKLNTSKSLLLEVDTTDLKMKFKSNFELSGTITNSTTGNNISGAEVILGDGTGLKLQKQNTDSNGSFKFKVTLDEILSGIKDSKENPWNDIVEGESKNIVINNIYFDYDKWNITFESERELDKIILFLNKFPTASLNINAHTDSRGSDNYNLTLSKKRAKSVMKYFQSHNIDTLRLMSFGWGETKLINKCDNNTGCSDALHKKNRRIEFEVNWKGTSHNTQAASPLLTNDNPEKNTTNHTTNVNTTSTTNLTGRWFKIQITTSSKEIECTKENFKGLDNVEFYIDNGIYKYTIGAFKTKEEALEYRKNITPLYPQAFPIELENGKRLK